MSIDPQPPLISATVPDWSRETLKPGQWHPGKKLIRTIRRYQAWKTRGGLLGWVMSKWYVWRWRKWRAISGAEIQLNARIGGGLSMPHPNGIVIHSAAEIGVNCLIMHQVTIGTLRGTKGGAPRLGGHVDVGAGAKILGAVTIGDHARIGANAVVLSDVPPGATAVGIPAKIIQKRDTATSKSGGDQSRTLDP